MNRGECVDKVNGFECKCAAGWKGTTCSEDVDDCNGPAGNPCQYSGTCTDTGTNAYQCTCLGNYEGKNCEHDVDDCANAGHLGRSGTSVDQEAEAAFGSDNPECLHGGTCMDNSLAAEDADSQPDHRCAWRVDGNPNPDRLFLKDRMADRRACRELCMETAGCSHYTYAPVLTLARRTVNGRCILCSSDVSDYKPGMGYTLYPLIHNVPGRTCMCTAGWEGDECERDIDDCAHSPCHNGGTCTDMGNQAYHCECPAGYEGDRCENDTDECRLLPCQHGGTCINEVNGHRCECPAGYEGPNCETDTDECIDMPCHHGGTCTDKFNGFECACPRGFVGHACEINVDDCTNHPCENGGTCTDGVDSFTCTCAPGFEGKNCEVDIDECAIEPSPCKNGASCTDGVNTVMCTCRGAFTGDDCGTPIDCSEFAEHDQHWIHSPCVHLRSTA